MLEEIEAIWKALITEDSHEDPRARVYRLLGKSAKGVRASIIPSEGTLELLVEVPSNWHGKRPKLPAWRGMTFEILQMSIAPRREHHQLALSLNDPEEKSVFLAYCSDLVRHLEEISDAAARIQQIEDSIARWGRFFEKCGSDGLDIRQQAGLFGELLWLEKKLEAGIDKSAAVQSWKGCERNFHDFDLGGRIVEVKTSMTKEPQQIMINNERQLDDRGLKSLHLFFAALRKTEGGGKTLTDQVNCLRQRLAGSPAAQMVFDDSLLNAGFLDVHAPRYKSHFVLGEESLFEVMEGFPRIIDPPNGIGSLKYGVLISACRDYLESPEDYLELLVEENNVDDIS